MPSFASAATRWKPNLFVSRVLWSATSAPTEALCSIARGIGPGCGEKMRSRNLTRRFLRAIPGFRSELPVGGGEWTRTTDLRIMSRPAGADSKHFQQDSSADSGKVEQNPQ